jgi:hypothetical protein
MSNQPGDFGESNNDLFPQNPNTLLDLSDPEAWKLPGQDGDDEATVHADMEISDVYCHLEQAQHLSPDQQQATPTTNAVATGPAALTDDNSIEMGDVDQFMERTLEDDQMKFMGTATLDIPWRQNATNEASGLQENQRDADWCEHCQSICITKMDYRKVSASSRVGAPHATSSSKTAAVPVSTVITVSKTDRNQLPRQQHRAIPGNLINPQELASMNDASTSGVSFNSPSAMTMPKRPMHCKPLTAYNYFYRVERDSIVNGMTRATDPLPPVDHDVSLKKQEKLLQQHW